MKTTRILDKIMDEIQYITYHFCQIKASYIYTQCISYTFIIMGRTPPLPQNSLNSLWVGSSKVLETFLRDSGPCWLDSITQLLQICQLHIDAASSCPTYQKCSTGLRPGDFGKHWTCYQPAWDDVFSVTCCVILMEVAIRR